jgi:hypothetical protein
MGVRGRKPMRRGGGIPSICCGRILAIRKETAQFDKEALFHLLSKRQGVVTMPLPSEAQRLKTLQQQECAEWVQSRTEITEHLPRTSAPSCRPQ